MTIHTKDKQMPVWTADPVILYRQIERIENLRLLLQTAIEEAEPAVADHYNALAFALDGRALTGEEMESIVLGYS